MSATLWHRVCRKLCRLAPRSTCVTPYFYFSLFCVGLFSGPTMCIPNLAAHCLSPASSKLVYSWACALDFTNSLSSPIACPLHNPFPPSHQLLSHIHLPTIHPAKQNLTHALSSTCSTVRMAQVLDPKSCIFTHFGHAWLLASQPPAVSVCSLCPSASSCSSSYANTPLFTHNHPSSRTACLTSSFPGLVPLLSHDHWPCLYPRHQHNEARWISSQKPCMSPPFTALPVLCQSQYSPSPCQKFFCLFHLSPLLCL